MSNVIKSFRVIEGISMEKKPNLESENEEDKIRDVLLYEARKEADTIIRIAEEQAKLLAEEKSRTIINEAESIKEGILTLAHENAKEILEESRVLGYNEGHKKGYDEGYKKGYDEGKHVSDSLINESLEIKNGYIYKRDNMLKDLEEDIIRLVIQIYEKILGEKTDEDERMITSLVLNGMQNLDPTDKLTIISSKEDFETLEKSKNEILSKASLIKELEIKYDINLEKGDCILETAKGNIDISIKDQLNEVRDLLTTILNNE